MKKLFLQFTCIFALVLSFNTVANAADCNVFFEGKTEEGKDISACSLNQEVFLKISSPNHTPDLYIQSKESDVLYVEADTFINDTNGSVYGIFIPNGDKWYAISFGRYKSPKYSTSVISGENLNKTNFYSLAKVESSTPIERKSVLATIDFSKFTRMEDPKNEKEYKDYLLAFYKFAGFSIPE